MADTPPPRDRDPIFDNVEKWRDELDERWLNQFAGIVTALFVALFALALLLLLIGCDINETPPTLIPIEQVTTTICTNQTGTTFGCYLLN